MPGVESCESEGEGVGALRKIKMGANVVIERLESFDDDARTLSYSIQDGPIPVQNYLATIAVSRRTRGAGSTGRRASRCPRECPPTPSRPGYREPTGERCARSRSGSKASRVTRDGSAADASASSPANTRQAPDAERAHEAISPPAEGRSSLASCPGPGLRSGYIS